MPVDEKRKAKWHESIEQDLERKSILLSYLFEWIAGKFGIWKASNDVRLLCIQKDNHQYLLSINRE